MDIADVILGFGDVAMRVAGPAFVVAAVRVVVDLCARSA
jgi:hypothetical protein